MRWRDQIMINPLDYCDMSEWREISRSCAREHPELPPYELAKLVAYRVDSQRSHDRLWYRIKAIQRLSASNKTEAFFNPDKRKRVSPWLLLSGGGMRTATSVSSIATLRQGMIVNPLKYYVFLINFYLKNACTLVDKISLTFSHIEHPSQTWLVDRILSSRLRFGSEYRKSSSLDHRPTRPYS